MKKSVRFFVIYPLVIYIWLLLFLWFSQKTFVYFPGNTPFDWCETFQTEEQVNYKWTRFYEQAWNQNLIIFFHWNAWRACDRAFIKSIFEETNSSILFVEYSWYSDNTTSPNIKSILNDVANVWEYVATKSEYKNIYVAWRSLWVWPASYYAQNYKTDKLLLVSPYSSLYKIWSDKYPIFPVKTIFTEDYRPEEYLTNYTKDLLIIHGISDTLIPIRYWIELYESINSDNKKMLKIPNAGHNNIIWISKVNDAIIEYFR